MLTAAALATNQCRAETFPGGFCNRAQSFFCLMSESQTRCLEGMSCAEQDHHQLWMSVTMALPSQASKTSMDGGPPHLLADLLRLHHPPGEEYFPDIQPECPKPHSVPVAPCYLICQYCYLCNSPPSSCRLLLGGPLVSSPPDQTSPAPSTSPCRLHAPGTSSFIVVVVSADGCWWKQLKSSVSHGKTLQ